MHHAVAQRARSDPDFAGLGQQVQTRSAVGIVQDAAYTVTKAAQQGRQKLVAGRSCRRAKRAVKARQVLARFTLNDPANFILDGFLAECCAS